ncbi:hypothetical protein LX64_02369 [Chitinophaga skermanii]|uniref:Uncharacterized protein n=1 Tax=Chitinophaga skermanii TaxID=331697 RepID=A0A327QMW3_9BACT|nr:hypothetical protein [Chitinophaga skermanii]RAJ05215.1 hypothetical protein LX64_02369 [Chitinophaga skermanii]
MKATQQPQLSKSNMVSGKILHKETNLGLADLLVILVDLDKWSDPEFASNTIYRSALAGGNSVQINDLINSGDRIGSVLTGGDGAFSIDIIPRDYNLGTSKETKPDLLLIVLVAEEPGLSVQDRLLYYSLDVRLNAGSNEAHIIKLKTSLLAEKGVAIPVVGTPVMGATNILTSLERNIKEHSEFSEKKKKLLRQHIVKEQDTQHEKRKSTFVQPFIDKISKVPSSFRDSAFFVKQGMSVKDVTSNNIKTKVQHNFGPSVPTSNKQAQGYIYLSEQDILQYQPYLLPGEGKFVLPSAIVESDILPKIFRKHSEGSGKDILLDHPNNRLSRELNASAPATTTGPGNAGATPTIAPTTENDIPKYVAHQMSTVTSPEEQLSIGLPQISLEKRPTNEDIGQNISNTIFQKGPADVPAYYDFHSLKIAFENVWQEAIDLGLINLAERSYDQVESNGGNPFMLLNGYWAGYTPTSAPIDSPSQDVILEFPEALSIWNRLLPLERSVLNMLALTITYNYNTNLSDFLAEGYGTVNRAVPDLNTVPIGTNKEQAIALFKQKGSNLIRAAIERLNERDEIDDELSSLRDANSLVTALQAQLNTNYSFKYYAANSTERSVNFGLLLTYQQKWDPQNYQVGELVRTIPLAPGESKKYETKTTVKKTRSKKEQEDNLRISKSDTSNSTRAESDIVDKASKRDTSDASYDTKSGLTSGPLVSGSTATIKLGSDAGRDSQQTKKDFREATIKASQEYRHERKIEISTDEMYESTTTEWGEIKNTNDELMVTYLFYELQRLFKISERLYRLRPVILVAQEMPAPHEITPQWVIAHDWVLKRALVDDSFKTGMEYLYIINGEKLLLDELERTVKEQRQIIKELRQNVKFYNDQVGILSRAMQAAVTAQANALGGSSNGLFDNIPVLGGIMDNNLVKGAGQLLGFGDSDDETMEKSEAARIRREAATDAYQRAEQERRELMARLENENNTLNSLSKELAEKRKDIIEKETHIARLLEHIKANILYYMQIIWSSEYADQRFFRLLDTKVPGFEGTYKISINSTPEAKGLNDYAVANKTRHAYTLEVDMEVTEVTLKEVADLDNMLGFKGNYMIFPLLQSNVLTDFMMAPYIDTEFGLTDPDNLGNWSLDDFENYVANLRKQLGENGFAEIEEELKEMYAALLQDPLRSGDIVTVPTGSLFIEALPGSHTVLEYYKLAHRFEDVKKAQAEVRSMELDNIRRAARLVTKKYEDPKTDKKIVVHGTSVQPNIDINDI